MNEFLEARPDRYDSVGLSYTATRRSDPRIEAQLRRALAGATPVLNVGAGTGSYEGAADELLAIEPSAEMISRRPEGSAPAMQATAEALPLADGSFAAGLAVLTLHHWSDWRAGLSELKRVVRERIVILTHAWEGEHFWLVDYFPDFPLMDAGRMPRIDDIARELPGARIETVPIPKDCVDGFLCAFWARPEAYLDPVVRAGISCFTCRTPAAQADADARIEVLAGDLASGRWSERYGAELRRETRDYGYRLVIWER